MNLTLGVLIAMLAGAMNGMFALPMKFNKEWAWENNWFPFSVLSLAGFPWLIAFITVPHLGATFSHVATSELATAVVCGVLVYTGSLLFGVAIDKIGLGLSFALLVGTMNSVGVLLPLILAHQSLMATLSGKAIVSGVALSMVSVVLSFLASKGKQNAAVNAAGGRKNLAGALLAIAGGALSGLLPVSMAMTWSLHIQTAATVNGGASPAQAANAALALVLLGGVIPNCGYCLYLFFRKGTIRTYGTANRPRYWGFIVVMSVLYSSSVALWGVAISPTLLGTLGPSVGWAIFVGMIVLSSTVSGLLSGEWKDATANAKRLLGVSISVLIGSMVLVCYGNYLH